MGEPKPTKYLYLHSLAPVMTWCEIDRDEWTITQHRPEQYNTFAFNGQSALIYVVTDDNDISRQEALKCASTFVLGAYHRIDVDLDKCTSQTSMGQSLFHPR